MIPFQKPNDALSLTFPYQTITWLSWVCLENPTEMLEEMKQLDATSTLSIWAKDTLKEISMRRIPTQNYS